MFEHFFNDYKDSINSFQRKLTWYEVLMIVSFIVFLFIFIISVSVVFNYIVIAISFSMFLTSILIIYIYGKVLYKKHRKYLAENHKNNKVGTLTDILDSKQYSLYSEKGIDWLIQCCQKKLNKNTGLDLISSAKSFSIIAIYPIIRLLIDIIIRDSDISVAFINLFMIVTMLTLGFIFWLAVKPAFLDMIFPDKGKYESLCEDLEYIKTQIEQEKKQLQPTTDNY